jgi:phage terminase large subunit-like protein
VAFKNGKDHDFVVGLVAGRRGADIFLIDRVEGSGASVKRAGKWRPCVGSIRRLERR